MFCPPSHLHHNGFGPKADLAAFWNWNYSIQIPDVQYSLSGNGRGSDQACDG
jgi:hypothetical protein